MQQVQACPAMSLSDEDASSGKSSKLYRILLGQAPRSLQSPPAHHARSGPLLSHSQACIAKNHWMCRYEVAPRDDSLTLDILWHQIP